MRHKFAHKQPRFHPDLEWESKVLTNEFIDINRMALDDRYGKNAAPLSKRRNGIGFTDNKTPGLFGLGATRTRHKWVTVKDSRGRPVRRRVDVTQNKWGTRRIGGIQQTIKDAADDPRKAYVIGGLVAVGTYTLLDWVTHKPNRTRFQKMIRRTPGSLIMGAVALSIFAPSAGA